MAKFAFVALLLLVTITACMAAPAEGPFETERFEEPTLRLRRSSPCDGAFGDTACSASCIAKGKTGGSCIVGFCSCNSANL